MADELKDQRIPIMMSPSEVKAIDDWMFANRIKSRSQAIRTLVRKGFTADAYLAVTKAARAFISAYVNGEELKDKFELYQKAHNRLIEAYDDDIKLTRESIVFDTFVAMEEYKKENPEFANIDSSAIAEVMRKYMNKEL